MDFFTTPPHACSAELTIYYRDGLEYHREYELVNMNEIKLNSTRGNHYNHIKDEYYKSDILKFIEIIFKSGQFSEDGLLCSQWVETRIGPR